MLVTNLNIGFRILVQEAFDAIAQVAQANRIDGCNADSPRHLLMKRSNFFLQSVESLHDLSAAAVINGALGRQNKGTLGAVQQRDIQFILKLLHNLAGARL